MEDVNLISSSSSISKSDLLQSLLKKSLDVNLLNLEKRNFNQLEDIKKCYENKNIIVRNTDSCFVMLHKYELMMKSKIEASMKRNVSVRSGINTLNTSVASTSRKIIKNTSTVKSDKEKETNSANANKSTSKYGNVLRISKDKQRNLRPLSPESSTTNVKQLDYNKSRPKLDLNKSQKKLNDKSVGKYNEKNHENDKIESKLKINKDNKDIINKANFENLKRSKTKPKISDKEKDNSGKNIIIE